MKNNVIECTPVADPVAPLKVLVAQDGIRNNKQPNFVCEVIKNMNNIEIEIERE